MQNNGKSALNKIPVVILAGGEGISTAAGVLPKPLLKLDGKALLSRIIEAYDAAGFRRFIVAAGKGGALIRKYLLEQGAALCREGHAFSEYRLRLGAAPVRLTVADTGADSATGARLAAVRPLLKGADRFCLTYGDTISDIDPREVLKFHLEQNRAATLLAVHMPVRFRVLGLYAEDVAVRGFAEHPILERDYINGGYYIFEKKIFSTKAFSGGESFVLENELLDELSEKRELCAYRYDGFWHYLDSERDCARAGKIMRLYRTGAGVAS